MALDIQQIRTRIEDIAVSEAELSVETAREVAFHLTDSLDDLSAFFAFCSHPGSHTPAQVNEMLLGFLLHAPNHIAAAAKRYADCPVSDIFGVGAVETTTDRHH